MLIWSRSRSRKVPTEELANESRSTHITVAADMVFSLSHFLSGVSFGLVMSYLP
jgi:brefeldin A-inhibited guanine nucleotide-exchange protein